MVRVSFVNLDPSAAINSIIQEKWQKMLELEPRIVTGTVIVSRPHHRRHKGNYFHVQIHAVLPGKALYVNREPERNEDHEDVNAAIRDAFLKLTRQLQRVSVQQKQRRRKLAA